jgi:hypothetical protein
MSGNIGFGLGAQLWSFSEEQLRCFSEAVASKQIVETTNVYLKTIVDDFTYEPSSGGLGHQSHHEYVERLEWSHRDRFEYLAALVNGPAYKLLVRQIAQSAGCAEQYAADLLRRYLGVLIDEGDSISPAQLADHVAVLMNDLQRGPIEWTFHCYIEGLWLEDKSYLINNDILIRRTQAKDFESEVSADLLPIPMGRRLHDLPSAVVELRYRAASPREAEEERDFVLRALRVYRLCSVCVVRVELHPRSFVAFGGVITPGPMNRNHSYVLSAEGAAHFGDFLAIVRPVLRADVISTVRKDPAWIALERYEHALTASEPLESRITGAMSAFEALFLKASERQELAHRLAQRAAVVMRVLGYPALNTYRLLLRAYGIRSTFIHGARSGADPAVLKELLDHVLDLARVSVVVMGLLFVTRKKDELLGNLDNALLDASEDRSVREMVEALSVGALIKGR